MMKIPYRDEDSRPFTKSLAKWPGLQIMRILNQFLGIKTKMRIV